MSRNFIFRLAIISGAVSSIIIGSPASAACGTAVDGQWDCLLVEGIDQTENGEQGPLLVDGDLTVYHWYIGALYCSFELSAYVEVDTADDAAYFRFPSCQRRLKTDPPWT